METEPQRRSRALLHPTKVEIITRGGRTIGCIDGIMWVYLEKGHDGWTAKTHWKEEPCRGPWKTAEDATLGTWWWWLESHRIPFASGTVVDCLDLATDENQDVRTRFSGILTVLKVCSEGRSKGAGWVQRWVSLASDACWLLIAQDTDEAWDVIYWYSCRRFNDDARRRHSEAWSDLIEALRPIRRQFGGPDPQQKHREILLARLLQITEDPLV